MVEWSEFEGRLARVLRSVSDRVFVIVVSAADPLAYVQFAGGEDALHAEASSLVPGVEATLAGAGWVAPDPGQPNWSSELALPALTEEFSGLAARCVVALRDGFGVSGPGALRYQAWREAEAAPPDVVWPLERYEELDQGENPLALPELGLDAVV